MSSQAEPPGPRISTIAARNALPLGQHAADVAAADAKFRAHSQVFPSKVSFETKITAPAWKAKKSWALIATEDRAIHPDLMWMMAKRAATPSK